MHRNKTGPILPVVLTALTLLFGAPLVAEEVSDFDVLLRNALEAQKKEPASKTTKPAPASLTPAAPKQTMQLPPKTNTSAGWVAVESKDAEKLVASSTASGVSAWDAVPEAVSTKVAAVEPKKTDVVKELTPAPAASSWDTQEKTNDKDAVVTSTEKPLEEKPSEKQPADKSKAEKSEEKVANWDAAPISDLPSTDDAKAKAKIAKKEEPKTEPKAEPFVAEKKSEKAVEETAAKEPTKLPVFAEKSDEKPKTEMAKEEPKKDDKPTEKEVAKSEPKKNEPKKEEPKKSDEMSATLKKLEEEKENLAGTNLAGTPAKKDVSETASKPKTESPKLSPADKETKKEEIADKPKSSSPSAVVVQAKPRLKTSDFDNDETTVDKKTLVDASRVGDPNSGDKVRLMYNEVMDGLKARNMTGKYEMWKNYARSTLRGTSGTNTGSEIDGRYRLSWYQKLYDDPIRSVIDVEDFSRQLHDALCGDHRCYAESLTMMRKKLDVPDRNDNGVEFLSCATPYDALNEVKRCLLEAQMHHARALSTLTMAEQNELAENLVPTFSGSGCINGHTIPNRTYGRRLTDCLRKMDRTGIHDAAEALIPLSNKSLLALLDKLPEDAFPTIMLNGQKVQRFSTSAGDIIIGGRENNIYDLDSPEMRDVVCVIDLGGNDTYREGACNLSRPVLAVVDLHGSDTFAGSKPGIQGGSVLGVSIVVNAEGNNTYTASDVAQGSTLGGAGMLFNLDDNGNDSYKAVRRAQGHALGGFGLLVDRGGNDKFRAALWAQGFGAPGGFGVLENVKGNDQYYCGGLWLDSYPEHPGYDGWGQGIGAGIRQVANGGIGAIHDGAGDDLYEVDYFGHGGGYWLGVGFARDFGGNDKRMGTTLTAYDGGPRRESQWTRFSNGFGCHYALGYLFDDGGNDYYGGRIMGSGMAWDLAIGFLCDFNGDDKFDTTGGMTQGVGAEGSIGILYCYGGDDVFNGRNQAYASGSITYHAPSSCGSNFSFLINYGGQNKYGCGARLRSYTQRGTSGGYLIDRPTQDEAVEEEAAFQKLVEERQKQIDDFEAAQQKVKEEMEAKGRRYYPTRNRPLPISPSQRPSIGAVPSFGATSAKTGANESTMK